MKTKTLPTLLFLLFIISSFNCKKEIPENLNVTVNQKLAGTWYVNDFIIDGIPPNVPNLENLTMNFRPNEEDEGNFFGPFSLEESPYQIINDGTEISIDGKISIIRKLTNEEITVHGPLNQTDNAFVKISADKTY